MDAQEFLSWARDPIEWFDKADELRTSANVLWECYGSDGDEYRRMSALTTAVMIYAMAIEAALKGRLIKQDPKRVLFSMETDGTGKVLLASIKQFGSESHNLEVLAEATGIVRKNGDSDRRAVLRRLSNCLVWISRYPVPKTVAGDKEVRSSVPIVHQNDWVR